MYSFKEKGKYKSTISQFCEELNVGRNNFYKKLREMEILDENNQPNGDYKKHFIPYETAYTELSGNPSYYITPEGKLFITGLLTEKDLTSMKRSPKASHRPQFRYKHYRE